MTKDNDLKHLSDCSLHNDPADIPEPCDCGIKRVFECKNELISLAKIGQQMQWIPVDEKLPERPLYDWVLVATKLVPENWYGVPHIAELRNGVWYSNSYNTPLESTCDIVVTHWMPLPERPKDGDNNG